MSPRAAITKAPAFPLQARQAQGDCDGSSIFFCPVTSGNCYTGTDGFVGCCSTSGCVARTTCLEYDANPTTSCDIDKGGCFTCTDPAQPSCYTISNPIASQHIFYCSNVGGSTTSAYENMITAGSMAQAPIMPPSAAPSPSPTSTPTSTGATNGASPTSAANTSPASPSKNQDSNSSSVTVSGGAIAGIVIGACAATAFFILLGLYLRRRHNRKSSSSTYTDTTAPTSGQPFLSSNTDTTPRTPFSDWEKGHDESPTDVTPKAGLGIHSPDSLRNLQGDVTEPAEMEGSSPPPTWGADRSGERIPRYELPARGRGGDDASGTQGRQWSF